MPDGNKTHTPGREQDVDCVVIGGGPAGLTAALEMLRYNCTPVVLEKGHIVGGIARTDTYKGYRFDMGGHRFLTKSEYVSRMWEDMLGEEFLTCPRLSRIYYQQRYFDYPPRLWNTLAGLGFIESLKVLASYLKWQLFPCRHVETFEQWVSNAFGKRLYEIFFKTYTEKVWGIPCTELRAEWAAQRIKNLSLSVVIKSFFLKTRNRVTTLIDEFRYPRKGPGMMWEAARERIVSSNGRVHLNTEVLAVRRNGNAIESVVIRHAGVETEIAASMFISSMPVPELVKKLDPPPPQDVLAAACDLKHRDFLTVCLIVGRRDIFPDNWIYVHEPGVRVARIQNYKNWSEAMVPDPATTSLGMEYFCKQGDEIWSMSDSELIDLAGRELEFVGLVDGDEVLDGCVYRVANAYPVYDSTYRDSLARVQQYCDSFDNLRTVGRNGLHRYNNMDHSMLTAMYATRMLLLGEQHDLWSINAEQEYLEERVRRDRPSEMA
jgi:protoporphyrinogen oxidase